MKLYKTTASQTIESDTDTKVRWAGSQAEAASDRKVFNSSLGFKRSEINTEEVDVPTDKKGLLAWLNENVK